MYKVDDGNFNGYLSSEEIANLFKYGFKEKEVNLIKDYVYRYRDHLTGFVDFIGDREVPSKLFLFNIKHYGYLLEDNPQKVISKKDVFLRKIIIDKLIKMFGPKFLQNEQVYENRNLLKNEPIGYKIKRSDERNFIPREVIYDDKKIIEDTNIVLPKNPVIWTPNHHFKDDVLASYLATKRQSYILFGSMPQFYNTIDGILANMVGSLMTNRKVKSSKKASIDKAVRAIDLGADVLCFPEGVHNKLPNELLLQFWSGIYEIASRTGAKVVPIIHYIFDPTLKADKEINKIHTVIDDPVDITMYSEKVGLNYLRDIIASWYYLMMEKYGKTTREELINFYTKRALNRNNFLNEEDFEKRNLTSHEAFELYLMDLLDTVDWYDSEIELSYDYRPKDIIRTEDAFFDIANIENSNYNNVWNVLEAKKIVKIRKNEDYQRRF